MPRSLERVRVPASDILNIELDCHFPGRDSVPYLELVEKIDPMFFLVCLEYEEDLGLLDIRKELEKVPGTPAWEYFYDARHRFCRGKCQDAGEKVGAYLIAKTVFDGRARKFFREMVSALECK